MAIAPSSTWTETVPATAARTRITGGEWRGRQVLTPPDRLLRPTRALVREALFNILGDRVLGATFVDLFAGAGTVAFEALSRGAAAVVLVEHHPRALALVARTAERLGCTARVTAVRAPVEAWLRLHPEVVRDSICFVDAPYRDTSLATVLELLGDDPPAMVVCEHHRARALPVRVGGLCTTRRVSYGITDLSFLQPGGGGDA